MGQGYKVNCWEKYIQRSICCQTLQLPEIGPEREEISLPGIIDQLHQLVCPPEAVVEVRHIGLNDEGIDKILDRYTSELQKRSEFKMARWLVQDPRGDIALEPNMEKVDSGTTVWCRVKIKMHGLAIAVPVNDSDAESIELDGRAARKLALDDDVVPIDTVNRCVLLDSETEKAVCNTHFGAAFLCRVDPNNPIMFFPLDKRQPKFVNLPTLTRKDSKEWRGVVCFDPRSIESIPMVSDFIPLECATKMLFIVKFLGWRQKYRFPLGIIVGALPAGYSVSSGDLIHRIAHDIPLTPALVTESFCPHLPDDGRPCCNDAVTIDPQGSRDHDDALTCVHLETKDGTEIFEFGVHITDLQEHILKGSELDDLARKRARSVYQSNDKCISHMLPKEVTEATSLLPKKKRAAFSILGRCELSEGCVVNVKLHRIISSYVTSALELTYSEAQSILQGSHNVPENLQSKVKKYNHSHAADIGSLTIQERLVTLWKIAFYLRKARLGDAAYCLFMEEPDCEKHPEAHFLIEEFMIWTNERVAERILKSPNPSILRVQGPPNKERIESLIAQQGPNMATSLALRDMDGIDCDPSDPIRILRDIFTQMRSALQNGDVPTALHLVQFEHLHPQMAVPNHLLKRMQSPSEYCVSSDTKRDYRHSMLRTSHYTHFTSPLWRYIDLVVHRILHACLTNEPAPYTTKELEEICYECKNGNRQARNYESSMKSLTFASELMQSRDDRLSCEMQSSKGIMQGSDVFSAFVTKLEEGRLYFCLQDISLKWFEDSVPLRCLNASLNGHTKSHPSSTEQATTPASSTEQTTTSALSLEQTTSSIRQATAIALSIEQTTTSASSTEQTTSLISSTEQSPSSGTKNLIEGDRVSYFIWNVKMTSFNCTPKSFLIDSRINLCQSLHKSHAARANIVLLLPEDTENISPMTDYKATKVVAQILSATTSVPLKIWQEAQDWVRTEPSMLDSQSMLQRMQAIPTFTPPKPSCDITKCHSPLWLCELQMPMQPCEVVRVQLSSQRKCYVLTPAIQLLEVGPGIHVCIQHNLNPSECFSDKLTENASRERYQDVAEYFWKWEKVVLAEAAHSSIIDSDFLLIKDVHLVWPSRLTKRINSYGQVYYQLPQPCNKEEGVKLKVPHIFVQTCFDLGFNFVEGDLVCVRYRFGSKGAVFHMMVHYVSGEREGKEEPSTSEETQVFLKFVSQNPEINCIRPSIHKLLTGKSVDVSCEVQLIPLSLPHR